LSEIFFVATAARLKSRRRRSKKGREREMREKRDKREDRGALFSTLLE
jgi:hypothetical protein